MIVHGIPSSSSRRKVSRIFGIALEENFPLVHTLEYPPELLSKLSETKQQVTNELEALKHERLSQRDILWKTHILLDKLKTVIDPVQKIWTDTFAAAERDITNSENGIVQYHPEDWLLLSESLRLQDRVIDFIFDNPQSENNGLTE